MNDVLAIIPARGGSKGLPRKNVLALGGTPLVGRTILAAREAESVARVVVTTDDEEIAEVARGFGAEVVMRPARLANDVASSESAILHALEDLRDTEGYEPEVVVFLQCTSPLTTAADIDGTVRALDASSSDSAFAAARTHQFLWRTDPTGAAVGVNHNAFGRLMRQQREPEFLEAGSVYAMRTNGFIEARHRFFGRVSVYEIPMTRVLEVDEPADLMLAEARLEAERRSAARRPPIAVRALAMDFDGVHTDDRVFLSESGQEAVLCSRRDGLGIEMMRVLGLPMIVISRERVPLVVRRCEKLGIPCVHGEDSKLEVFESWLRDVGVPIREAAYLGNDANDVDCLRAAGLGVVPVDAHPSAIAVADLVLRSAGGRGAVRELCDLIAEEHSHG